MPPRPLYSARCLATRQRWGLPSDCIRHSTPMRRDATAAHNRIRDHGEMNGSRILIVRMTRDERFSTTAALPRTLGLPFSPPFRLTAPDHERCVSTRPFPPYARWTGALTRSITQCRKLAALALETLQSNGREQGRGPLEHTLIISKAGGEFVIPSTGFSGNLSVSEGGPIGVPGGTAGAGGASTDRLVALRGTQPSHLDLPVAQIL